MIKYGFRYQFIANLSVHYQTNAAEIIELNK
jgi:hypothetical protein